MRVAFGFSVNQVWPAAVDALQNGFAAAVAAVEGANVGATGVGDSDAVEVAVIAVGNITPGVFNGVVGAAGAVAAGCTSCGYRLCRARSKC